jgi:hypothetical protein
MAGTLCESLIDLRVRSRKTRSLPQAGSVNSLYVLYRHPSGPPAPRASEGRNERYTCLIKINEGPRPHHPGNAVGHRRRGDPVATYPVRPVMSGSISRHGPQAVIHAPQQRYRRFWRPSTPSIVGEAPSRATKPTTVIGYIIIIPVQASDPFAVALLERFGECGFRCFVACAVTRNDPDRAYTLN